MDSPGAKRGKETTEQRRGQPWTGETRGIWGGEQQRPLKKQGQEFTQNRERAGAVTIVF